MKAFVSLAVLAVLVSCGPAPELKRRLIISDKLSDGRVNLDTKTPAEVLKIKYNNEIFLNCELKADSEKSADGVDIKPARFALNLAVGEKSRTLSLNVGDSTLEAEISADFMIYKSWKTEAKDGVHYEMDHTPVVTVSVKTIDNNLPGAVIEQTLLENLPDEKIALMDKSIPSQLNCAVNTTPAPKYEVEFRKIEEKTP